MHEMSIAQNILDIVVEEGQRNGLNQVKLIRLQIGALAAVVPESLRFCFELMRQDTIASEAVLEIETLPVVARCSECATVFEVEDHDFTCAQCGMPAMELISGRELNLVTIEGETGEEDGGN